MISDKSTYIAPPYYQALFPKKLQFCTFKLFTPNAYIPYYNYKIGNENYFKNNLFTAAKRSA